MDGRRVRLCALRATGRAIHDAERRDSEFLGRGVQGQGNEDGSAFDAVEEGVMSETTVSSKTRQ